MPDLEISPAGGGSGTNTDPNHFTENADGFTITGGTAERDLVMNGADVEIQGSGTNTYTFPSSTQTIPGLSDSVTLTNKTLSSGTKINPGSTAAGDIWYSTDSNGTVGTLNIGSANQFLRVNSTATGFTYSDGSGAMQTLVFHSGGSVAATRYIGFGDVYTVRADAEIIMPKGEIKAIYGRREVDSGTGTFKLYKNGTLDSSANIAISSGNTGNATSLSISFNGTTDRLAMEVEETVTATTGSYTCTIYYIAADP